MYTMFKPYDLILQLINPEIYQFGTNIGRKSDSLSHQPYAT